MALALAFALMVTGLACLARGIYIDRRALAQARASLPLLNRSLRCSHCHGTYESYCVCGQVSAANGYRVVTDDDIERWWASQSPECQAQRGGVPTEDTVNQLLEQMAQLKDAAEARVRALEAERLIVLDGRAQRDRERMRADAAEARVRELEQGRQWQPIATAPQDGTWILGGNRGWFLPTIAQWSRYSNCWQTHDHETSPTHWMPLPTSPRDALLTRPAGEEP